MLSPSDLSYFTISCQELNFTKAANQLGIAQPSLSYAIQKIEKNLGVELFIRRKEGLKLTRAGEELLSHTKNLLHQWDKIKCQVLSVHNEVHGTVSLGCPEVLAQRFLPQALHNLVNNYQKLNINLTLNVSKIITEKIIDMSLDIGIVTNPIRHLDLIIKNIANDCTTLWYNPNLVDLNNTSNILLCNQNLPQSYGIIKELNNSPIKYSRIINTDSYQLIKSLAESGCGIAIIPESMVISDKHSCLIKIKNTAEYKDEISLIYRHENKGIKSIKEVISAITNLWIT